VDTRIVASRELSEEEIAAINDLVRESGVICTGLRDNFLIFSTAASSRNELTALVKDIVSVISGDDVPPIVRDVRDRTRGITLIWS